MPPLRSLGNPHRNVLFRSRGWFRDGTMLPHASDRKGHGHVFQADECARRGEFECTSDRWQPTPEELKALSAIPGCSLRANFRNCYAVLAKHWGDSIKPLAGLDYDGPWTSRDMTTYYKFFGNFIGRRVGQVTRGSHSGTVK